MRTVRGLLAATLAGLVLAGCSSTGGGVQTPAAGSAADASVADSSMTRASMTSAPMTSAPMTSALDSASPDSSAPGGSRGSSSGGGDSTAEGSMPEITGTVTVYAASSLKKSFDTIGAAFEKAHPGSKVQISYDGSSTLVTQLTGGAPADVFASADQRNMKKLTDAGLQAGTAQLFASNTLQIAVAPGNPKKITGLAALAKDGVVTVLCAAEVPCGSAAHTALEAAKVAVDPASEEQNVTAVVTKVSSGEADAGLVYKTDVSASGGKVDGVDFPESSQAVNKYPIVALKSAPNAAGAAAFVDLVTGAEGQKVLAGLGFAGP